jgi:3-methyl-2-oxobutanoate hydroxymethyltransferase
MVIADMPFGTYHVNEDESVKNALRLMKYGGAEAVKLEGGRNRVELVKRLVNEEIPVVAHIGLTPQSVYKMGGYRVQGRTSEQAKLLIEDAKMLEDAGAFAVVLELVPREVAAMISKELTMSTIGIGAGVDCDIQVLVLHDLVGMTFGRQPRFVRQYVNMRQIMTEAIQTWTQDVKSGAYPNDQESYGLTAETKKEMSA